jgi:ABC-type polysaccharide/polyol phosphate transport system ATPase subunit
VQLTGVSKVYVKYEDSPMLATALLRVHRRTRRSRLWAVRDVDLEVQAGECFGVVGRNGSGKSTLLQMLSGITAPTSGRVQVRGRVAPLISVGVGFHPELTGRDNVYVNGTILGLTRAEIDRRFDAIVEFAELADFIDTPVKFYSSGMSVRLGFAVAVQADPEVLVVDEVLAVGDFAFQMKCFERINDIRDRGTTVLVVSHNLNAIRQMCDRAMLMHSGQKLFEGSTADTISRFHEVMEEARELEGATGPDRRIPLESGYAELLDIEIYNPAGKPNRHFESGEQLVLRVRVNALRDIAAPFLGFVLTNAAGVIVYSDSNRFDPFPPVGAGTTGTFEIAVPVALPTGSYNAGVLVGQLSDGSRPTRMVQQTHLDFYVAGRRNVQGAADLAAQFVAKQP